MREQRISWVCVLAVAALTGSVSAEDSSSTKRTKESAPTGDTLRSTTANDLLSSSVFKLPSGTKLNAKQQRAFDKLKAKYNGELHDAMALIHSTNKEDKAKGLKDNRDIRAQIKSSIQEIVAMPSVEAAAKTSSYSSSSNSSSSYSNSSNGNNPYGNYAGQLGNYRPTSSYASRPTSGYSSGSTGSGGSCPPGHR